MTDKVHLVHWCRCGAWASFGNRNTKGDIIWTCGANGCVKAGETTGTGERG